MEKNKIKIKPPSRTRVSNPQFEKLQKESEQKRGSKNKSNKKYRGRIKALLAAGLVGLGIGNGIVAWKILNGQKQNYTIAKVSSNENNEAVIKAYGGTRRLDENSFALVRGKIEDGENFVYAYDENGNILEGTVDEEFLTEILVMSEQELSKYDMIYQVMPEQGASVRTSATEGADNVSYTANYGDYVLGTTTNENEWIAVLGTNGEDVFQGYIDEEHLELVSSISEKEYIEYYGENARTVNTSKADYNNLHLRRSPDMGRNVLTTIPHGSVVKIIGETVANDSREWTEVEYTDTTGTKLKGWVATEYLKEFQHQEQEENTHNIAINASGNVTGIDISGMSPEYLRELLQKGIPESVKTKAYGETDVTQMAGDINFVFIKLGKSGYGKGKLKLTDYSGYEEQVKVCEELGVPYGFYYYATSINEEEAQMEADYIIKSIEELREKYDLKYNIMPPVIDRELTDENDRQYGQDIQKISDATAYIINSVQEEGISENVLIYAPGRVMDPGDSDRLIDLERIKEGISNPNSLAIWLCAPTQSNGEDTSRTQKYYDLIEKQLGVNIVNRQMALDATVGLEKGYDKLMDVNNMEVRYFTKLLHESQRGQEMEASTTGNSLFELIEQAQDDER